MAGTSRKRNADQNRNDEDQDERSGFLLFKRRLGHFQTSCNNGDAIIAKQEGALALNNNDGNDPQFLTLGLNFNQEKGALTLNENDPQFLTLGLNFNQAHVNKGESSNTSNPHFLTLGLQAQEGASTLNNNNKDVTSNTDDPNFLNLGLGLNQPQRIQLPLTKQNQEINRQPQSPPASKINAVLLKIGSRSWASENQGDLLVKFYYSRKKLVWEFFFGSLLRKMEIRWAQVSAINAYVDNDSNESLLKIELEKPPEYFEEGNTQRLQRTKWERTNDFTGGEAQHCRRHSILFSPGVLHEHLEKLFQCDNRLLMLSQQPFPFHNSEFFDQ